MAILTLSRQYGSGGREIGRAVAEVMKYDYVDRQTVIDDMRNEGGLWKDKAEYFDENYPDVWERSDWAYRGFVALNQSHFLQHAVKGDAVIMGRGGNFLLKQFPFVMKVRTIAPVEKRIERIMEREGINAENASYLIEKADSEMTKAVYLIYGRNLDDPKEYDKVFDTSQLSQDEIVSILEGALVEKDKYKTPEALQALRLRALAEKIKAAILSDPSFHISALDVDPKEEGLVKYGFIVQGLVHRKEDIGKIEEIAKKIAGYLPVEFRVTARAFPRFGRLKFS
jgi:cytidylate kinase